MVRSRSPGPERTPSGWVRNWYCSKDRSPMTYSGPSMQMPISSRSSCPSTAVPWTPDPTRTRRIVPVSAIRRFSSPPWLIPSAWQHPEVTVTVLDPGDDLLADEGVLGAAQRRPERRWLRTVTLGLLGGRFPVLGVELSFEDVPAILPDDRHPGTPQAGRLPPDPAGWLAGPARERRRREGLGAQ